MQWHKEVLGEGRCGTYVVIWQQGKRRSLGWVMLKDWPESDLLYEINIADTYGVDVRRAKIVAWMSAEEMLKEGEKDGIYG